MQFTPVDLWAMAAAAAATIFLALRSQMLRPTFTSLHDAPVLVYLTLSGLALCCAGVGISIWNGQHANAREALLLTFLAVASGALFFNLLRQARGPGGVELEHQP